MSEALPVFVNDQMFQLAAGATVADAVAAFDPGSAAKLTDGVAHVTDGRGIRFAADTVIHAGMILRVVVTARRERDEADAHS